MAAEVEKLIADYAAWLADKTKLRDLEDGWTEITAPYLDRHNDYLQVYLRRENGSYVLTDDAHTIEDLRMSGCELDTPKRKRILTSTLNGFGVNYDDGALTVKTTVSDFPEKKHSLIQAMLAVNDLFFTARAVTESLFLEDVQEWLTESRARFTPNVKFVGRTHEHNFHFVVPGFGDVPERVIQTVNSPDVKAAQLLVFSWEDTRPARPDGSEAYAFLNDRERAIPEKVNATLNEYGIHPVLWTHRESVREQLAA